MTKRIVSIDIGYSNMAMVEIDTDFNTLTVCSVHKIDLKNFNENEVHRAMTKFINKYSNIFILADIILIERQPPQGLNNIQDIIAYNYASKVKLICPRSMHKHFNISKLDYDFRKIQTIKIANNYLCKYEDYNKESRKHDIADSFCLALYYIEINKPSTKVIHDPLPDNVIQFIDSFKYIPF